VGGVGIGREGEGEWGKKKKKQDGKGTRDGSEWGGQASWGLAVGSILAVGGWLKKHECGKTKRGKPNQEADRRGKAGKGKGGVDLWMNREEVAGQRWQRREAFSGKEKSPEFFWTAPGGGYGGCKWWRGRHPIMIDRLEEKKIYISLRYSSKRKSTQKHDKNRNTVSSQSRDNAKKGNLMDTGSAPWQR